MHISIIIPTYNRQNQLEKTIDSIFRLKTSFEKFEIIVVDNGSTDKTRELVQRFQKQNPEILLKYVYDNVPGLLTGRHRGLKESKGNVLSFIDDDVIVSETWLDTIFNVMSERTDITFLTGPCFPDYEIPPPQWLEYFWINENGGTRCGWLSLLDFGTEVCEISPKFVWGLNYTIRKTDLMELGGFHPDNMPANLQMFQGDGETGLSLKAIEKGKKALYHPGVMLYHQISKERLTFEYFDKRAFYQGVANSFIKIRKEAGLYTSDNINRKTGLRSIIKYMKKYINQRDQYAKKHILDDLPPKIKEFKARFLQKQKEGFDFHQQSFKTNPDIAKWCLKENYFDYKLPI